VFVTDACRVREASDCSDYISVIALGFVYLFRPLISHIEINYLLRLRNFRNDQKHHWCLRGTRPLGRKNIVFFKIMSNVSNTAQKSKDNEEVVVKPTNWVNIIATKLPLIGPKMPVLLQSEGADDSEGEGGESNDVGFAIGALGGWLALAVVLSLLALAIPVTLTIFAAKRNQPGTGLYKWMCMFLVLMWCSQLLAPVTSSFVGIVGGFAGFVGTIVMIAKGGGCGGAGCKLGQSGEELLRSIVGSVTGAVGSGSSFSSF